MAVATFDALEARGRYVQRLSRTADVCHTRVRMKTLCIIAVTTLALLSACSKNSPEPERAKAAAAPETLPTEPASGDVVRAEITAGGIAAEYAAHFESNQLTRIVEQRSTTGGIVTGEYQFKGARLIQYTGAKLSASDPIDLHFDMQGVLQPGQGATATEEELREIRGRSQLLRNHALAQRSTRTHAR